MFQCQRERAVRARSARDVRADEEKKCYRSQGACASSGWLVRNMWFFKLETILGKNLDKWRYSEWFVRNMWFFQTRNYFGQKFGQMAIFRVVCQKHVVCQNSKLFWATIWTLPWYTISKKNLDIEVKNLAVWRMLI